MWPLLLDMTREECVQNLRNLELEAYSSLVSALRAQGPLSKEKRRLLEETSAALNITEERHKAEVRRAISDERLTTIAYHITGHAETLEDWAQEGRRIVPLLPRMPPQTAYSVIADEAAEVASQSNKQLPLPVNTERKRAATPQMTQPIISEPIKPQTFRVPEVPKEESKKRKLPVCNDSSSLAQHLLGPKLSRIQQIYRQSSKPPKLKQKENKKSSELEQLDYVQPNTVHHQVIQSPSPQIIKNTNNGPKINVIQNISLQASLDESYLLPGYEKQTEHILSVPVSCNENQAPKSNMKPNTNIMVKSILNQSPGPSGEPQKPIKMCPPKKSLKKGISAGQKLIVVSNTQTITTNSILQKTLSVPMNKVTKLNLEKFKIVSNNSLPSTIQVTTVVNSQNSNSAKHKVVTLKTNPGKKVIPFSQLQMLNSKGGIKVLPLGGKILGKNITTTASPLYVMNSTTKTSTSQMMSLGKPPDSTNKTYRSQEDNTHVEVSNPLENGKPDVKDEVKEEAEDFESKIEEFQITQISCNDFKNECVEIKDEENLNACDTNKTETKVEDMKSETSEYIEPETKDLVVGDFEPPNMHCDETMLLLDSSIIGDIIKPN